MIGLERNQGAEMNQEIKKIQEVINEETEVKKEEDRVFIDEEEKLDYENDQLLDQITHLFSVIKHD